MRLDVGQSTGTSRIAQVYTMARGLVNQKETNWNIDGLPASSMQANGQVNLYLNEAMNEEVTYQTGGSAENRAPACASISSRARAATCIAAG